MKLVGLAIYMMLYAMFFLLLSQSPDSNKVVCIVLAVFISAASATVMFFGLIQPRNLDES